MAILLRSVFELQDILYQQPIDDPYMQRGRRPGSISDEQYLLQDPTTWQHDRHHVRSR